MVKKAIYIHGFAGSIHSETIGNLRKYYPEVEWITPEVDCHAEESIRKINDLLRAHPDTDLLMGSSLGAFYVLCADFAGRKLVINPTLHPNSTLKPRVGVVKYRGRRENGETEFKLTMADVFAFSRFKPKDTPLTLCHYTEHDQVMGEEARREYPKFFLNQEMTRDLKSHFMDEHYIHTKLKEVLA